MTQRLCLTLLLCGGLAQNAWSMDYMGMFNASNTAGINIAGTIAVNSAIKKQTGNATARSVRDRGHGLSTQEAKLLIYTPDPVVSRRVKQEFKTAVQRADPTKSEHIAAVLAGQDVLADFDRDMAPYGLRSNNIADAMSAYWITMWMIANQAAVPTAKRVAAVRQQVTANMLNDPRIAKALSVQRQEISEALVYETMFALGQRADAERRRDNDRQRELARLVQANMRDNGIDLQGLRLTTKGLRAD